MLYEKLGLTSQELQSLLGAILFKIGTSVTACWGSINLYFFSAFYHQGTEITPQTNSISLLIAVIPMVLSMIYAIKLCDRFGY